jgi:hypothetical protein
MTVLAQHLDEYLQLRRTLGHKLADAHRLLPRFVAYLDKRNVEFVTIEMALAWSLEPAVLDGSVVPAHRMVAGLAVFAHHLFEDDTSRRTVVIERSTASCLKSSYASAEKLTWTRCFGRSLEFGSAWSG